MRQPWLFANSWISSSDISRRTRNSAGWVTTYSEVIESLSPILVARAGKSLCICSLLTVNCAIRVGDLFLQWQRGRPLWFTVHSGPECVNSFAARRRATRGWFLHRSARCRGRLCQTHTYQIQPRAQALPQQFSAHWRGAFPWLNFVDVFGDDRATRAHH